MDYVEVLVGVDIFGVELFDVVFGVVQVVLLAVGENWRDASLLDLVDLESGLDGGRCAVLGHGTQHHVVQLHPAVRHLAQQFEVVLDQELRKVFADHHRYLLKACHQRLPGYFAVFFARCLHFFLHNAQNLDHFVPEVDDLLPGHVVEQLGEQLAVRD